MQVAAKGKDLKKLVDGSRNANAATVYIRSYSTCPNSLAQDAELRFYKFIVIHSAICTLELIGRRDNSERLNYTSVCLCVFLAVSLCVQ